LASGAAVEGAGRLVGEHQRGVADKGARDRHALLLAARQLARSVAAALRQPHRFERGLSPPDPLLAPDAGIDERHLDVLQRRMAGEQVVGLEHEADVAVADRRQPVVRQLVTSSPLKTRRPELGRSRSPMRFMSVDLPDPDGPMMATNSPGRWRRRRRPAP
jgi:hypothetical protein